MYAKSIFDIFYKENFERIIHKGKILGILIKDRTSDKNIIWATNDYSALGSGYQASDEMTVTNLYGSVVQRRSIKSKVNQSNRAKDKAEVFTAPWICNLQNNLVDEQWFGTTNIFNKPTEKSWITNNEKIKFSNEHNKTWQDYVLNKRMEVSCGEAPYLVSRYDTVTGHVIEKISERIGLLDRKLRVISENVDDEVIWFKWVQKAYQSIYGYEYQGDNLFLARENLLLTFIDNIQDKFKKLPAYKELKKIAEIISWNIWQMDAITCAIPICTSVVDSDQFPFSCETTTQADETNPCLCKIKDWCEKNNKKKITEYKSLMKGDSNG